MVLRDQAVALERVAELVDREDWRADKRTAWTAMLRRLVFSVDWETGLVCGLTRAQLAATGDVGLRTVSSMLAWARRAALLVEVEAGATAEFLGTDTNRAPSYVLTIPAELAQQTPVDGSCNLPASSVRNQPLGLNPRQDQKARLEPWPLWDRPETPADRQRATATLLERIGLGHDRVVAWRAHGLLTRWWTQGACVAGLLHALDHHPDHPQRGRGDALRAARDPLCVLGHRLGPWSRRLDELPGPVQAVHPADRRARAEALNAAVEVSQTRSSRVLHRPTSSSAVRTAALAALADQVGQRRRAVRG